MPVNATHPEYDASLPAWQRARDVLAGEDAVKAAREKYLPRLDSQSDEEYVSYRKRAAFFNATARTAEEWEQLFRSPLNSLIHSSLLTLSCSSPNPRDLEVFQHYLYCWKKL